MSPMWLWSLVACAVAVAGDMFLEIDVSSSEQYNYTFTGYNVYSFNKAGRRIFNFSDVSFHSAAQDCVQTDQNVERTTLYNRGVDAKVHREQKWQLIKRTMIPGKCEIGVKKQDTVMVLEKVFYNNSTSAATFNVGLSFTIEENVETSWEKSMTEAVSEIPVDVGLGFSIGIFNLGVSFPIGGNAEFSSTMQNGEKHIKTTTIGTTSGMSVVLQPKQSVAAQLLVQKGELLAVCDYINYLTGHAVIRFPKAMIKKPCKKGDGCSAWNLCIEKLMEKSNVPNIAITKGKVAVSMYFGGRINVYDVVTGYRIHEREL